MNEYLEQIKNVIDNIPLREIGLYALAISAFLIMGRAKQGLLEGLFTSSDNELARQRRAIKQERTNKDYIP